MSKATSVSHSYLKSRLTYSPLTGIFRWRDIPKNRHFRGKIAGTRSKDGSGIIISLLCEKWTASRLAWFYMTGEAPAGRVQHKNRNQNDCRFENLTLYEGMNEQDA